LYTNNEPLTSSFDFRSGFDETPGISVVLLPPSPGMQVKERFRDPVNEEAELMDILQKSKRVVLMVSLGTLCFYEFVGKINEIKKRSLSFIFC
jgi:hypothetical protein